MLFGYTESHSKRDMFLTWKALANTERVSDEVNTFGPVVEQVLEDQIRNYNLKLLMKDQGYTKPEIGEIEEHCKDRVKNLL